MRDDDVKTEPRFATLLSGPLGLIFRNLNVSDFSHMEQINRHWRKSLNFEQAFRDRFPELYDIIRSQNPDVAKWENKHWKKELYWVTRFANYFPERFGILKRKKMLPKNWSTEFNKEYDSSFLQYPKEFVPFLGAFVNNHSKRLERIMRDFNPDLIPGLLVLCATSRAHLFFLSSDSIVDREKIRADFWQWLKPYVEGNNHLLLVGAVLTCQSSEIISGFLSVTQETIYALMISCERGNQEVTELILNQSSKLIKAVLPAACYSGNLALVRLVARKADLNAFSPLHDTTPLGMACRNFHLELVAYLINAGADPLYHALSEGTPLSWALTNNFAELVELIIKKIIITKGVNAESNEHRTMLHMASEANSLQWVEFLVSRGANVNALAPRLQTPLHYARAVSVANFLIQKGALIDAPDNTGYTLLNLLALTQNSPTLAEFLIEQGADITLADNRGSTPLSHLLNRYSWDNTVGIEQWIFLLEASVNQIPAFPSADEQKWRHYWGELKEFYSRMFLFCTDNPDLALICAILTGKDPKELARIIDLDANIHSNKYQWTPLALAQQFNPEAYEYLKSRSSENQEFMMGSQFAMFQISTDEEDEDENAAGHDSDKKRPRIS